eukprot:g11609.t1
MTAAYGGHSRVTRVLLDKGASISIARDKGVTALHGSANKGRLAASKLLVEARPRLEAEAIIFEGYTSLHLAAVKGCRCVLQILLDAGANPNSRTSTGATQQYLEAVRQLLLGEADTLVTKASVGSSHARLALDAAARNGHSEVMSILADAGVIDTGKTLVHASVKENHRSMKFLLQRQIGWRTSEGAAYVNNVAHTRGLTPLLICIVTCLTCAPVIAQLLVGAGADTISARGVTNNEG